MKWNQGFVIVFMLFVFLNPAVPIASHFQSSASYDSSQENRFDWIDNVYLMESDMDSEIAPAGIANPLSQPVVLMGLLSFMLTMGFSMWLSTQPIKTKKGAS